MKEKPKGKEGKIEKQKKKQKNDRINKSMRVTNERIPR